MGYFDPGSGSFSSVFSSGLVHPQQVAIDIDGEVWADDMSSPNIAGYPAANPGSPVVLNLPGTISTAVTIAYDNSVRYGIIDGNNLPALAQVQGKSVYSPVPNTEIYGAYGFIASSLAADVVGGFGIGGQEQNTPTTYDFYLAPGGQLTEITYQSFEDAGQVGFTSHDYVGARGGYGAADDGICIWSSQNCFSMANDAVRHPSGLSIDGAGSVWLADNSFPSVEQIPLSNGSYLNGKQPGQQRGLRPQFRQRRWHTAGARRHCGGPCRQRLGQQLWVQHRRMHAGQLHAFGDARRRYAHDYPHIPPGRHRQLCGNRTTGEKSRWRQQVSGSAPQTRPAFTRAFSVVLSTTPPSTLGSNCRAPSSRGQHMTKIDITDRVTALGDLTRRDSEIIVETMFDAIVHALKSGEKVEIRGFGSFRTRQRNSRTGRNPKTGATVSVPAKRVPFFKASKELRELVDNAPADTHPVSAAAAADK